MMTKSVQNDEADAYAIARAAGRFKALKNGVLLPDDLTAVEKRVFLERTRKVKRAMGGSVIKRTAQMFRENSRFFQFSKIPAGTVNLPKKEDISAELIKWISLNEGK
jgi:hypothetical protein